MHVIAVDAPPRCGLAAPAFAEERVGDGAAYEAVPGPQAGARVAYAAAAGVVYQGLAMSDASSSRTIAAWLCR